MLDAKPLKTPLVTHFRLSAELLPQTQEEERYMSHVSYLSAVGPIMYAIVCTCPDISHAISVVNRYVHNPGKVHWQAVNWIL